MRVSGVASCAGPRWRSTPRARRRAGTSRRGCTRSSTPAGCSRQEPSLATTLGLAADSEGFTAVEQEPLDLAETLEEVLAGIEWPSEVDGCAAAVERLVLPPSAEESLPDDAGAQRAYAAGHPERQEVRIVAAVLRDGSAHCALRVRGHDDPHELVEGPDLVPALVRLLADTLDTDLRD